ncbi:MAG: DUF975 family protein [Oscillospiraceae bacterium]|jgi:hypothetical protein|nr:DUF975 family protein [Oscillospiraceae bacterium]
MFFAVKIKREARANLAKGNWLKSIVVFAIFCVYFGVVYDTLKAFVFSLMGLSDSERFIEFFLRPSFDIIRISAILLSISIYIFVLFLFSPLIMGSARFYFEMANGVSPSILEIFYFFKTPEIFCRVLFFAFEFMLKIIKNTLLCLLPGFILLIFCSFCFKGSAIGIGFWIQRFGILASVLVILAGVILSIFWNMSYFAAPFLFLLQTKGKASSSIKQSSLKMKNHRGTAFLLTLNFLVALIPCFLILPILYVFPLFFEIFAIACKYIVSDNCDQ